jgi:hypothetical protein
VLLASLVARHLPERTFFEFLTQHSQAQRPSIRFHPVILRLKGQPDLDFFRLQQRFLWATSAARCRLPKVEQT